MFEDKVQINKTQFIFISLTYLLLFLPSAGIPNLTVGIIGSILTAMISLSFVVEKQEVYEKTRPYFRYTLKKKKLSFKLNLSELNDIGEIENKLNMKIKEKNESGATFVHSGDGQRISVINIITGTGRDQKIHKINLTENRVDFYFTYLFRPKKLKKYLL